MNQNLPLYLDERKVEQITGRKASDLAKRPA